MKLASGRIFVERLKKFCFNRNTLNPVLCKDFSLRIEFKKELSRVLCWPIL